MDLYQEQLLDHYKHPRNCGTLETPDFSSGLINPSCGDSVMIQGIINHGVIADIRFSGKGCVISQATASLLTELVKGKSLTAVEALHTDDILNLIHIPLGPLRIHCALLSLQALKTGILTYKKSIDHVK